MTDGTAVVMQPYQWPSAEHLFMSAYADQWIFLDLVQLSRKSWMTRNRLRNSNSIFWFGPRIAHNGSRIRLCEARVLAGDQYANKLRASLDWYRKHSPYGGNVYGHVSQALAAWDSTSLVQLNVLSTQAFFDWLGLDIEISVASEVKEFPTESSRGLWALEAAQTLGVRAVLNPESGTSFFDFRAYLEADIALASYACDPIEVSTKPNMAPGDGLSWIDTASWYSPTELRQRLATNAQVSWLV